MLVDEGKVSVETKGTAQAQYAENASEVCGNIAHRNPEYIGIGPVNGCR